MPVLPKSLCYYKCIDHYWSNVSGIVDENWSKKYARLFCLVKCILSLSHDNASPERVFSIIKLVLECHGYIMKTIPFLHHVW